MICNISGVAHAFTCVHHATSLDFTCLHRCITPCLLPHATFQLEEQFNCQTFSDTFYNTFQTSLLSIDSWLLKFSKPC